MQVCHFNLVHHEHASFGRQLIDIVEAEMPRHAHVGKAPDKGGGTLIVIAAVS